MKDVMRGKSKGKWNAKRKHTWSQELISLKQRSIDQGDIRLLILVVVIATLVLVLVLIVLAAREHSPFEFILVDGGRVRREQRAWLMRRIDVVIVLRYGGGRVQHRVSPTWQEVDDG